MNWMLDLSDWASKNNRATDYLFDTHLKQNNKVVGWGNKNIQNAKMGMVITESKQKATYFTLLTCSPHKQLEPPLPHGQLLIKIECIN